MATTRARKTAAAKGITVVNETAATAKPVASRTRKPAAAKATGTRAAKPKAAAADAPVPVGIEALNENLERAAKAKATNAAAVASGQTQQCEGKCEEVLPITKFPTTTRKKTGEMGRGTICRACRNEARADAKAGK